MHTRHQRRNPASEADIRDALASVEEVYGDVENLLDYLDEGSIEQIWLVGSRAEGKAKPTSDWDFLVVGPGLGSAEEERIRLWEEEDIDFPGLGLDVSISMRSTHHDVILSDEGPYPDQVAILLWKEGDPFPE
jgi:predicted nucleotidyltransferase